MNSESWNRLAVAISQAMVDSQRPRQEDATLERLRRRIEEESKGFEILASVIANLYADEAAA